MNPCLLQAIVSIMGKGTAKPSVSTGNLTSLSSNLERISVVLLPLLVWPCIACGSLG